MSKTAENNETPVPASRVPYMLAAVSLCVMSAFVACIVLTIGFADYNPDTLQCVQQSGGHPASLPDSCQLPVNFILRALMIFIGGCSFSAKVWSRR